MEKQIQNANKAKGLTKKDENDQQDNKPVVMEEGKKYYL